MGKLLTSHRSTTYPCYLPVLGESAGAGRIRLTRGKGIKKAIGKNKKWKLRNWKFENRKSGKNRHN